MLKNNVQSLALFSIISDDYNASTDDFTWDTFPIDLAQARHFAELLGIGYRYQTDSVLCAESFDELCISGLIDGFR